MAAVRKGRPAAVSNPVHAAMVESLAGLGTPHPDIGVMIGMHDLKRMRKLYANELAQGKIKANASVAKNLFNQAKTNSRAAIFWMKAQAGWRESPAQLELSGPNGGPIQVQFDVAGATDKLFQGLFQGRARPPAVALAVDAEEATLVALEGPDGAEATLAPAAAG